MAGPLIDVRPEVAAAVEAGTPVVALESTLIAQGLPWPVNLETARAAESAVRAEGAVPATIAVWKGRPTVGLAGPELEWLARNPGVAKASRRDLAVAVSKGQTAATTVAATIALAHMASISFAATGGIGGAHRAWAETGDISADLYELARTRVAVVCAGAKSILDIPRTLELLESLGVPVVGFGMDDFPAFYVRSSGRRVAARVDTPEQAAALVRAHWELGGAGVVLAQPLEENLTLDRHEFEEYLTQAERDARTQGVQGPALTPFLLARLGELTQGKSITANQALVVANARLAARVALSSPTL